VIVILTPTFRYSPSQPQSQHDVPLKRRYPWCQQSRKPQSEPARFCGTSASAYTITHLNPEDYNLNQHGVTPPETTVETTTAMKTAKCFPSFFSFQDQFRVIAMYRTEEMALEAAFFFFAKQKKIVGHKREVSFFLPFRLE
jgi:hypothetical protein